MGTECPLTPLRVTWLEKVGSGFHLHKKSHRFANNSKNILKAINSLHVFSPKHVSEQSHCGLPLCVMVTQSKSLLALWEQVSAQGWSLPLCPEVGETSGELGKTSGVKQTQAAGHRDELLQLVATRVSRSLTVSFPSLGYNNAKAKPGN